MRNPLSALVSLCVALAGLTPLADAQSCSSSNDSVVPITSVTGRIVTASDLGSCMQGDTHMIEFTDVYLQSQTIDLGALEGLIQTVCGTPVGDACNVLEVIEATNPVSQIKWGGMPQPGAVLNLVAGGDPGLAIFMLSPGTSYLPLDPYGTFHLNPAAVQTVAVAPVYEMFSLTIPSDASLVGLDVYCQAVALPTSGNPLAALSNPLYLQIL